MDAPLAGPYFERLCFSHERNCDEKIRRSSQFYCRRPWTMLRQPFLRNLIKCFGEGCNY